MILSALNPNLQVRFWFQFQLEEVLSDLFSSLETMFTSPTFPSFIWNDVCYFKKKKDDRMNQNSSKKGNDCKEKEVPLDFAASHKTHLRNKQNQEKSALRLT